MAELADEYKVYISAEVEAAIRNLQKVDDSTKKTEKTFKLLGKSISAAFIAKEIIDFGKTAFSAWEDKKQTLGVLNSVLETTGANAWTSSKQLQQMGAELQKVTNYAGDSINQMQSVLLGFKSIKGDTFEEATKAILDMATVMKMDLSSAAQTVGKALDDPVHGLTSLQRQGFFFTASQKEMIQAMLDVGDTAGAQKIILDELASTYGGAAEASQTELQKMKNAWGDFTAGVGGMFDNIGKEFASNPFGQWITNGLSTLGDFLPKFPAIKKAVTEAYSPFADDKSWNTYYSKLETYEEKELAILLKIQESEVKIAQLKAMALITGKVDENKIKNEEELIVMLKDELKMQQEIEAYNEKEIQAEAEKTAAVNNIKDLMGSIAEEYEKLSSQDPEKQLEAYNEQLKKIAQNRKILMETATGLDTSEALKQLEYNEKAITEKINSAREKTVKNGKKTWQQYLEEVLGLEKDTVKTGADAATKYIEMQNQMMQGILDLNNEGLKISGYDTLHAMRDEVENILVTLLSIPDEKINETFNINDDSIQAIKDFYDILNTHVTSNDVEKQLQSIRKQIDDIGKSEKELTIQQLQEAGATEEQLASAGYLLSSLELAQKKLEENKSDAFTSWEDELEKKLLSGITKLRLFGEEAKDSDKALAGLATSLATLGLKSAVTGISELGKALGEGSKAGESLKSSLVEMASAILDSLPELFLQAGLTLIAQGQWPLGLGLVTAGLTGSFLNGLNQGYRDGLSKNAKGNVFGATEYSAFAKGGYFTNSIVSQPTFFKFAKGSGFGTGLMGEAGPEAIMPLHRGADGSLGVQASGFGNNQTVLLMEVHNYTNEKVETRETTTEDGQKKIMMYIGAAINQHITGGRADKAMASRFGIKPQGV